MKISKEQFIKCMNAIKKAHDFNDELRALHRKYDTDGEPMICEFCEMPLVELLDTIFSEDDKIIDDIAYFVYELDFGERVRNAPKDDPWVITEDNKDISNCFATVEALYDYLAN